MGRTRGRGTAGGSFPGPSRSAGLVGRWRRRFPDSPAPDADGGAFRPSPTSFSTAGAGAGEAGRAGSGEGKARGRRLRGAGGGGGGRRAGGRAGRRRRRRREPCRTQLQAGQPRRLRDAARPWRDGDLTGAGPSDQVETSPEPFRQPGNAGELSAAPGLRGGGGGGAGPTRSRGVAVTGAAAAELRRRARGLRRRAATGRNGGGGRGTRGQRAPGGPGPDYALGKKKKSPIHRARGGGLVASAPFPAHPPRAAGPVGRAAPGAVARARLTSPEAATTTPPQPRGARTRAPFPSAPLGTHRSPERRLPPTRVLK